MYYETGINLSMEQYTVAADDYLAIDQAPVVSHASDDVQNAPASITNTVSVSSITGRSDVGKTEQEKGVRKRWRLDMQRTSRNPVNIVISGMKRKRNAGR